MGGRCWITAISGALCLAMQARGVHPAAGSSNEFCFAVMDNLSEQPGNLVFSPFSVWSQMTMMAAGAAGETRQQMHNVLAHEAMFPKSVSPDNDSVHPLPSGDPNSLTAEWLEQMRTARGTMMSADNRIWTQSGLKIRPVFENLATRTFGATMAALDFASDASGSARQINMWVAGSSGEAVKEVIAAGAIRPDTQIVLTSTFGFDGKWATPFEARKTTRRDFTRADGRKALVEMMSDDRAAGWFEDDRLQAVRLRFQGADASLVIVLPKKQPAPAGGPFLSGREFMMLVSAMRDEPRVALQLPKFRMAMSVDFSASLRAIGMTRAFGTTAELSGLCDQPAMISSVLHSTAITVGEGGLTSDGGADVNPVSVGNAVHGDAGKSFFADRPFYFFVFDESMNGIVLAGIVADPAR